MAQVLKEDIKEQIIAAAKAEFLTYGFKDASMRRIALNSKTSLGNLYRYFKNKEDVNYEIVKPTLCLLDGLLLGSSANMLSLTNDDFKFNFSSQQLKETLLHLTSGLMNIYQKHRVEFKILLLNSQLNKNIENWFIRLTQHIMYQNNQPEEILASLAKTYATSAFAGFKQLFQDSSLQTEQLKKILDIYMFNYIDSINKKIEVNYER